MSLCGCVRPLTARAGQVSRWVAVFQTPPSACSWLAHILSYRSSVHLEWSLAFRSNSGRLFSVFGSSLVWLDVSSLQLGSSPRLESSTHFLSLLLHLLHCSIFGSNLVLKFWRFTISIINITLFDFMHHVFKEKDIRRNEKKTGYICSRIWIIWISSKRKEDFSLNVLLMFHPLSCVYDCLVATADVSRYRLC